MVSQRPTDMRTLQRVRFLPPVRAIRTFLSHLDRRSAGPGQGYNAIKFAWGAMEKPMVALRRIVARPRDHRNVVPVYLDFPGKCVKAMSELLDDRESEPIVAAFREAFEYKRDFPSRGEKKYGLPFALQIALGSYSDPKFIPFDDLKSDKKVDGKFKELMIGALTELDGKPIRNFEHSVRVVGGISPEKASVQLLEEQMRAALAFYGLRKEYGVSENYLH